MYIQRALSLVEQTSYASPANYETKSDKVFTTNGFFTPRKFYEQQTVASSSSYLLIG